MVTKLNMWLNKNYINASLKSLVADDEATNGEAVDDAVSDYALEICQFPSSTSTKRFHSHVIATALEIILPPYLNYYTGIILEQQERQWCSVANSEP